MTKRLDRFIADAQRAHKRVATLEKRLARVKAALKRSRRSNIVAIKRGVQAARNSGVIDNYAPAWEIARLIAAAMGKRFKGELHDDLDGCSACGAKREASE